MQEFGLIPDLVFGRFPDGFGARLQWQAAGKTGWNHCPSWTTNTPSTAELNACHAVHQERLRPSTYTTPNGIPSTARRLQELHLEIQAERV